MSCFVVYSNKKAVMSKTKISSMNQNLLWAISGGRCEYDGCNEVLYTDILTKKHYNAAYIAHIVADSPDGPRGDTERSPLLANNISNLMLLCDKHHRLIDKEDVEGHPEYRLLEMKKKHEERIARQTAIAPNKSTQIVLYGANIGDHASPLSYHAACNAISPDYYPAMDRAVEIGLTNSLFTDNEEEFWHQEVRNLCRHIEQQIVAPIRAGEYRHYSIFALAPQPLLIKLGTLINDLHSVKVFQKHREPDTWKWLNDEEPLNLKLSPPSNYDGLPVLIIGLSATINPDRITTILSDKVSIWYLSIENPNNDCTRSEQDLFFFRRFMRLLFDKIKSYHGCKELHIFPAMPVTAAIELGRVWMPKADMPMVIYDQNKVKGGFYKIITIN